MARIARAVAVVMLVVASLCTDGLPPYLDGNLSGIPVRRPRDPPQHHPGNPSDG